MGIRRAQLETFLVILLLSCAGFAQNSRFDDVALGPRGPIPAATVVVCTQPANVSTQPCSPLAVLCSSLTDLVCTQPNPVTADSLGNYHFYIKQSESPFTVQIYGPQVAFPFILPDQSAGVGLGSNNTFTGTNIFTGSTQLNGGGALAGTFTGSPTFSGNPTFSGSPLFTGQLALTPYSLDNILFVDGNKYTTIASAVTGCPANGCEIWTPNNYRETLTSQLLLGAAAVGNTKPIILRLGHDTVITENIAGGVCGIVVPQASSIQGAPGTIGANGSNVGGAVIQVASTANISAAICNGDTTGSQEYFALASVFVMDNASATVSGALVDLQAVFVPSYIRDSVILPAGHVGLRLRDVSGFGFGPFNCDNCWLNGQAIAGSQPLVIQSVASGGSLSNVNFFGGAIEHAGTGQFEAVVDGTAGPAGSINSINFFGTYCENSFAASSCFKFKDTGNWNLIGVTVDGIAGADVVNIAQSAANRAGVGIIHNLRDINGYTNLVNDTIRSTTIASAPNNGSVPLYVFTNPGFTVAPFIFGGNTVPQVIGSGTAAMTTAAIVAGNCGTTVTVSATGVATTDTITWAFNAAPAGSNAGLVAWPTTNNVNFAYCSNTAQTPAAATINWRVVR
jgi:hypothetical protein